jgi:hypothetical protein
MCRGSLRPRKEARLHAQSSGRFPKRTTFPAAQRRRHSAGNIKARQETIDRLVAISDRRGWVFGETLEYALDALEQQSLAKPPTAG